eukprot:2996371-Amphidinium_carterae.1
MDVNTYRLQQNWNTISGELATKVLTSPYRSILLPNGDKAWMRVQDAYIQNANPYECPPLMFREEEDSIPGNHSREEEHLERNDSYRPPPLPPLFPEEPGQDDLEEPVVVDEEGEEVDRS